MNQREAKRAACAIAATMLENDALEVSALRWEQFCETPEDRERMRAAFREIVDELKRRGDMSGLPDPDDCME